MPEGGFAPSSDIRRAPQSVSAVASNSVDEPINTEEYGGLAEETSTGSGGLIGTIMNLIGLGNKKSGQQEDKQALGKAVSNLIGGENSPLPAKNVLSNVLYKALTAGSVQVRSLLQSLPFWGQFKHSAPSKNTAISSQIGTLSPLNLSS